MILTFFPLYYLVFTPGDSTINQLTYLSNTFCRLLDDGFEVWALLVDIIKAFSKVWLKGLLYKPKSYFGWLLIILVFWISLWNATVFSTFWYTVERVGSQCRDSSRVYSRPLLFLTYIYDIVDDTGLRYFFSLTVPICTL